MWNWMWKDTPGIPALGRRRQAGEEFKVILGYTASEANLWYRALV